MPWPPRILASFAKLPDAPSEADFHGPYNKLLHTIFPSDSEFTVVPQYLPGPRDSPGSVFTLEVLFVDRPVLILKLWSPGHLRYPSTREAADLQIRYRIRDLAGQPQSSIYQVGVLTAFGSIDDCPLPVLHAVSAMGTQLCFYKKPRNEFIVPSRLPAHPELETDTAPEARWSCSILEEEGEQKFRRMVDEIKQGCAAL